MRLNQASDFALRILMLLAEKGEPMKIDTIATDLGLVKSHVMKISAKLTQAKIVESKRGRIGGVSLARAACDISVGEVVRAIEADFAIVECMRPSTSSCTFMPQCRLRHVLHSASNAFLAVLDAQTLDGLVSTPGMRKQMLEITPVQHR